MKTVLIAAACCIALSGTAFAYKTDAAGKCHDEKGKFAKADLCATPAAAGAGYKLDAKGKCHDAKGKFAKAEMCKA